MNNTNTIRVRVEMTNNSSARALDDERYFEGVPCACHHNGGKTVLMVVVAGHLDALETELAAAYGVRSYTVL